MINWRQHTDNGFLLPLIANCRNVSNGQVGFTATEDYAYWMPVLKSSFTSNKLTNAEKNFCVNQALNDPNVDICNADSVIDAANAAVAKMKCLPRNAVDFVFPITHKGGPFFGALSFEHILVDFLPGLKRGIGANYLKARRELLLSNSNWNLTDDWENICFVRARTSARFIQDAFDAAEMAVGTALGLANINVNSNARPPHILTFGVYPMHLINLFRMGQFFSVHETDGSLSQQQWWFQNDWKNSKRWATFSPPLTKVRQEIGKNWRRVYRNPHSQMIAKALTGYTIALSNQDADEALLAMWRVLEQVTLTDGASTNHKQTVSRLKNMVLHDASASIVVNHLRHSRNDLVHRGKWLNGRDAAVAIHQHEWILRAAIIFLIENGGDFGNRDELERFLDLPNNRSEIAKLSRLVKVRQSIE